MLVVLNKLIWNHYFILELLLFIWRYLADRIGSGQLSSQTLTSKICHISSFSPLSNKHALPDILLIHPQARVLNKLLFPLVVPLVLRHTPKIVILIILIIVFVHSSFCLFFYLACLCSIHPPVCHYVDIFSFGQLEFQILNLFCIGLLLGVLLKDFVVLLLYYFFHFGHFLF